MAKFTPTPVAAGTASAWQWLGGRVFLHSYGSGSVRVETSTDLGEADDTKTNISNEGTVTVGEVQPCVFPITGCWARVFCVSGSNVSVGWSA
ncbi:hypothetical protein [Roseomonas sp. BN140053]|uniref:hypothetical protein n=1 Tax=Roseomonas sp. BN140053 TaxID=3391898 RepID=UPI0039E835C2